MTAPAAAPESIRTTVFNWHLIRYQAGAFAIHSFFTVLLFGLNFVPGLIVKVVFDTISGAAPAQALWLLPGDTALWWLIGLYVLFGAVQIGLSLGAEWYGWTFRLMVHALLRSNVLASILRRPGDLPLPVSPGEAINRLRVDVGEVGDFPTWLPDQVGKWVAAVIAVIIMARINLPITLVIFVPLVLIILLTRLAWGRILFYNRASARAGDAVTGFLNETLGAVQAIKVADADEHVTARYRRLNAERAQARIRHDLFRKLLDALNASVVTFGIGVVLLMAGTAIGAGRFTVGDFALFVSYLWFTTQVPSELGTFYGDFKTQEISIDRLLEMVRPEPARKLVQAHPVYARGPLPAPAFRVKTSADRLEWLEVRGLTFNFPANDGDNGSGPGGISGVNLTLKRGDFVVITGRVGAGKTTLLRTLLGILPPQSGEILWNGRAVHHQAAFFRPPRVAYTAQVPRLFSDTLRENVLMGLPEEKVDLPGAVYQAVLEPDVGALDRGLDTVVGPRGIRLSGGQVQRSAAARMFVRAPELLVFDDLSSALDVETEQKLWDRLDARRGGSDDWGITCLVVSHRRAALRRADHIVVLKNGIVEAEGRLDDLLEHCEEMQRLWRGDVEERDQDARPS